MRVPFKVVRTCLETRSRSQTTIDARRKIVLDPVRIDSKKLLSDSEDLDNMLNELKRSFLAGDIDTFGPVLRQFECLAVEYSFEITGAFSGLEIDEILFDIVFDHQNLFPPEIHYSGLVILQELTYSGQTGFPHYLIERGLLDPLISCLTPSVPQDYLQRFIDILLNVCWEVQGDAINFIMDSMELPGQLIDIAVLSDLPSDGPHFRILSRRTIELLALLSYHFSLRADDVLADFGPWFDALNFLLQSDLCADSLDSIEPESSILAHLFMLAGHLCVDSVSAGCVSRIESLIERLSNVLNDSEFSRERELKIAVELLDKFIEFLGHDPEEMPGLDFWRIARALECRDEKIALRAAQVICRALKVPWMRNGFVAANIMPYLRDGALLHGYDVEMCIVESVVILANEVSWTLVQNLIRDGCVPIVTRGLAIPDVAVQFKVVETLIMLLRNYDYGGEGDHLFISGFIEGGGLEFLEDLGGAIQEPESEYSVEFQELLGEFLRLYEEADPDGEVGDVTEPMFDSGWG
jgi:hypothetical protein